MATILTKRSNTASSVPLAADLTNSTNGAELAVNTADKRLFVKDSGGSVQELGTNPSSLTLSGGTVNGLAFLNASKVLTTGSALTFDGTNFWATAGIEGTKATTAGNISLYNSVSSQLTHYQQLSSSYSASYIQSALSGASSSLVFAVNSNWTNGNASEQMRLTSTGLGIGTSSPGYKLDVRGEGFVGSAVDSGIRMLNSGGVNYLQSGNSGAAAMLHIGNWYSDGFMRLDSSGNLGLGVTPSAWESAWKAVDIGSAGGLAAGYGETDLNNNVYRLNTGAYRYKTNAAATTYNQSGGGHYWFTAPSGTAGNAISFTQAMTLDASGRLGIGTTSPQNRLHTYDDNASTSVMAGAYIQNVSFTTNSQAGIGFWAADNFNAKIYTLRSGSSAGNIVFATNGGGGTGESNVTERARIDSSGNLGIGASSPAYKLDVVGDVNITGSYRVNGTTFSGLTGGQTGSAPLYGARAWVNFNGTGTVAIRASGNVSSITDNGTGDYTVNFTNAMPDANYSAVGSAFCETANNSTLQIGRYTGSAYNPHTTSSIRISIAPNFTTGSFLDSQYVDLAIFR